MLLIRGGMRIESRAAAGLIAARLARPRLHGVVGCMGCVISDASGIPPKALFEFHACVLRSHPDIIVTSAFCNACRGGAL